MISLDIGCYRAISNYNYKPNYSYNYKFNYSYNSTATTTQIQLQLNINIKCCERVEKSRLRSWTLRKRQCQKYDSGMLPQKEFAFSASKKGNLRAFLSSWNSREYSDEEFGEVDVFDQIGKPCQLQVVHNETGEYANVANLMPLPRGVAAPVTNTNPIRWDMEQWDDAVFAELPEWIQEQIKKSTQYQKEHTPTDSIEVKTLPAPAVPETAPAPMSATAGMGGAPF